MDNQKIVLVTGGTGNQGGAIARNLHKDKNWKVEVLTRNPDSRKSLELKKLGIEVVKGDLDKPSTYKNALDSVYGIFSVQNYQEGIEKEIKQGQLLADAAKAAKIEHFIYSSVSGADLQTGIPHFDSKYKIEEYIKSLRIPYSIIRPTSFYENLLNPEVKKRILKGKLVMPVSKDLKQEFISVEDIGRVALKMFNNPSTYVNKTLTIASDSMTHSWGERTFIKCLSGLISTDLHL